ncbi:MAG: winged helix-turn-helix domain-containing protein [Scandinavium sp.]|uniref:winged helix-turn-helix domain-containing protein n=1 Tax=Scandinavium sp. TaxID=2830653 RepID=UPI003F2AA3AF
MDYQLHGFIIGREIHFDIHNQRLYRLPSRHADQSIVFVTIGLNKTMLELFLYLMRNARQRPVSKDELIRKVWEENNLSCSSQRLWQVLNNLSKKLELLGLPENFVIYVKGEGYRITDAQVRPVYVKESDVANN